MIKRIANIGLSTQLNIRQRRVIQLTNLMAIIMAPAILVAVWFNGKLGETVNSVLLIFIAAIYLSILAWNKWGLTIVSKVILGFFVTLNPFINLFISGRIPDGQFISIIPASIISFCALLVVVDRHSETILYYFGLFYYLVYASFIDVIVFNLSEIEPDLPFIRDNYYFYKVPYVICMVIVFLIFHFFKTIIYNYEQEAEHIKMKLETKNIELMSLNQNLESKVKLRTKELSEFNDKLIDLAFITAHEIRGPLTSILGVTHYLTTKPEDQSVKQVLPQLHEKSVQMDQVITKMVRKLEGEVDHTNGIKRNRAK